MGLSKTDYMRGIQCPRMLWLDKHKPELKVIPPENQIVLDAGNEFGDRAMGMFGPYEEMTILWPNTGYPNKRAMVQNTLEHLEKGTPVICEAAFSFYGLYCALDILKKVDTGYEIYEVKNSREVREQYVRDVGFQYYVVKRCKLNIEGIYIVTHGEDEADPFVINDVTERAKGYENWVDDNVWNLDQLQKEEEELETEPGEQCQNPYLCWYYGYCNGGDGSG